MTRTDELRALATEIVAWLEPACDKIEIVTACRHCNRSKYNRTPEEWLA